MQTIKNISASQLYDIITLIYEEGTPTVREAYSAYDTPTREFKTRNDLLGDVTSSPDQKLKFLHYSIYYPEARGFTIEERINLKPEKCGGHTFRFSQVGWGLIFLQCDFKTYPAIECRIAVNSRKRAELWASTYPEFGSPDLWDWDVVDRYARKLIRRLRKHGTQAEQTAPADR